MSIITVLIADNHTIFRESLRAILRHENDLRVVGEAATCAEALSLARTLNPSIIVIDTAMPDQNGLDAALQIMTENPRTKIVILSMYDDQTLVTQAMKGGIKGYLIKQSASSEFIAALRAVNGGHAYFSTTMNNLILAMNENHSSLLTCREIQVLQKIVRGISNRKIAAELTISIKTVEKHRQQIMDKLNIHDVAGLTRFAVHKGLV